MQFEGTIKNWNDERGFGFIEPAQGGQDIFMHAKAFRGGAVRPRAGDRVQFEIEAGRDGRKRARRVTPLRSRPAVQRMQGPAQWGTASFFAIPAFMVIYLVAAILWRVPNWAGGLYAIASIATFAMYAVDKSAARAGHWRVSEITLQTLSLVGGWPGAIVAQQVLRHKSVKREFRTAFWGAVVVNVALFLLLASPLRQRWIG